MVSLRVVRKKLDEAQENSCGVLEAPSSLRSELGRLRSSRGGVISQQFPKPGEPGADKLIDSFLYGVGAVL